MILDWRLAPSDKEALRRSVQILAEELGQTGLGRLWVPDWLSDQTSLGWPPELFGSWHHMGTTRMGVDPASSVVDRDGRVHSVENLWIAGSSVFPTYGWATPTLTILALALRLADHLRRVLDRLSPPLAR